MDRELLNTYRKFRRVGAGLVGRDAECCLRNAKTLLAFRKLEDDGIVRLRCKPETDNYFDVYGEPETEKERADIVHYLDLWGLWWVTAEWKTEDGEWERADSIGMCCYESPLDPFQNAYIPELMDTAVKAATAPSYAI